MKLRDREQPCFLNSIHAEESASWISEGAWDLLLLIAALRMA
jgi:hypothetical protein